MTDVETIPVKDFVLRGIKLKATCRTCGSRERIIEGGLLARTFSPRTVSHSGRINQFAKRLVCGNCKGRWPKAELGVWP